MDITTSKGTAGLCTKREVYGIFSFNFLNFGIFAVNREKSLIMVDCIIYKKKSILFSSDID